LAKFIWDRVKITLHPITFDRRSALKFKRNVISNLVEATPLSEILMLKDVDVDTCSKIFECLESIRVNDINSDNKEIILFNKTRREDGIWRDA
jgi:hypothetical protein